MYQERVTGGIRWYPDILIPMTAWGFRSTASYRLILLVGGYQFRIIRIIHFRRNSERRTDVTGTDRVLDRDASSGWQID